VKKIFLVTQNVSLFREAMGVLEDTEYGQPGLAVVYGMAGRGKSKASESYAMNTDAVYFRVLHNMTDRQMLASLCNELTGMEPRSAGDCMDRVIYRLKQHRRILLVDEADRLKRMDMFEYFRDIHDLTGAPIVFIGEESLYSAISCRRRLWSRVTQSVHFGPICTEDILLYAAKAFQIKIMPDAAVVVSQKSDGDFRLMHICVRDLSKMVRTSGDNVATLDMVKSLPQRKTGPKSKLKGGRRP